MKSATGAQLSRAFNLAFDHTGKRIPPLVRGFDGIKCKETRPHALSNAGAEESREELMEREGRLANQIASLTPDEKRVLELQAKLLRRVEHVLTISESEIDAYLHDGYTLIPKSEQIVNNAVCVDVAGYDVQQTRPLSYDEIAEEMAITRNRVGELVRKANKKMREGMRR